jgi:hypothetical protein
MRNYAAGFLTSAGERFRVDPMDLQRDRHRQSPLAVFVPHLNRDVTSVTFRQAVPSDLGRSFGSHTFGDV